MPSALAYPLTTGARHSWVSIEAKLAGKIFYITAINYSRKRNRTMVRVNTVDPIAKTRGSNEYAADCEMLLSEYQALKSELINQASQQGLNGGYGDVQFDVVVQYHENGLDDETDTIKGCSMDSTEASNAEGTDATKRKFDLAPLKVLFGGQDDLSVPLQAPLGG